MTNWVSLGTDVMARARKAKGLSYEAVARQASVSSKTYERYEKAGRVPEHLIPAFADILGLEIERPTRERVIIEESPIQPDILARLQAIEDEGRETQDLIARGFAALGVTLPARELQRLDGDAQAASEEP